MNIKQFFARHKWAGPTIGFILGTLLGTGAVWQFLDYRLKSNTASLEQAKLEKDYYERLQSIQYQVSSELIEYVNLRDRHMANRQDYQAQNAYSVLLAKLTASIAQYNRLEAKLCTLERRKVRWFVVPVPPPAPQNPRTETKDGKTFLVADVVADPLQANVNKDAKAIVEEYSPQSASNN